MTEKDFIYPCDECDTRTECREFKEFLKKNNERYAAAKANEPKKPGEPWQDDSHPLVLRVASLGVLGGKKSPAEPTPRSPDIIISGDTKIINININLKGDSND